MRGDGNDQRVQLGTSHDRHPKRRKPHSLSRIEHDGERETPGASTILTHRPRFLASLTSIGLFYTARAMAFILATMLAAGVFGVIASVVIAKASSQSPLWNVWFAVSLVVASAGVVTLLVSWIIRRMLN